MKRTYFQFFLCLVCLTLFQSCSKDDSNTYLTDEAKSFVFFEEGDTFQLKNVSTDEIISLTVQWKKFEMYKDNGTPGGVAFGPSSDSFVEYGECYFSDVTECYNGTIFLEARGNGNFELSIYLGNCFYEYSSDFKFQNTSSQTIEVSGTSYPNAYLFTSAPDDLFYSKEKGILKIFNNFDQEERFIIVE